MSRRSGRSKAYSDISDESLKVSGEDDINIYEAEGEDDDEQEITRCVCGQDELNPKSINQQLASLMELEYEIKIDSGLFIQCDKCSVWQHGYCVGLFTDEDVPDKYWCELCKPDLHIILYDADDKSRTFYKLVNEKRKKLLLEFVIEAPKGNRTKTKRITPPASKSKTNRKERRYMDDYDEQLQKAIRESAKESGIVLEEESKNKKRSKAEESDESSKKSKVESKKKEQNNGHVDDGNDDETDEHSKSDSRKSKSIKSKSKAKKSATPESKNTHETPTSREELINQASKPRYVSDKSSIYELRKRTGAILEWLGRSQLELEEQKLNKIELYSYKERTIDDLQEINEESKVIEIFNENLKLMEKLTEKILSWEQKFGKYAP